jgi:hypothetical protein
MKTTKIQPAGQFWREDVKTGLIVLEALKKKKKSRVLVACNPSCSVTEIRRVAV